MAHTVSVHDLPRGGEKLDLGKLSKVRLVLLGVAIVGALVSAVLFFGEETRKSFAYSWLFAFSFVFTLGAGGMFWMLLHHASNSGWGIVVRRLMEQVANMLPFIGILGLPLLLPDVRQALWEWMAITKNAGGTKEGLEAAHETLLAHKHAYLNLPFWLGRYALYFVLMGFGAFWLRRYSLRQDETGDPRPTLSARRFACGWLPVFAVCITFAAIDWLSGLDYTWFSTMWGVYIFAGSALSAMALIILTSALLRRGGYLSVVNSEHFHLMGKLMFAFVVFWAYITFSQFFLIWYANITEETRYFLIRNTDGWNTGSILTYLFAHFVIPFVLLLPAWVKRNPKYLTPMACWVLFAHALDLYFVVIPERGPSLTGGGATTIPYAWIGDIVALITIGAIFAFVFIGNLGKHRLYPCGDPRLHESLNVQN